MMPGPGCAECHLPIRFGDSWHQMYIDMTYKDFCSLSCVHKYLERTFSDTDYDS